MNQQSSLPPIILIAGPTASGKSRLALEMAEIAGGEILNGDSIQVYRDLRVLTARPSREEEDRIPHYGYGFLDPYSTFSAGEWREWAEKQIYQQQDQKKPVFIVGGTGLYLKALTEPFVSLPPPNLDIRKALQLRAEHEGLSSLYEELLRRDPQGAKKLAPKDHQRILRALEVVLATGKPLHYWQTQTSNVSSFSVKIICLQAEKKALVEQASRRVIDMIEGGAIDEVKDLIIQQVPLTAPIYRALGAQAIHQYLHQQLTRDAMIEQIQIVTRQYIKRQYTWFRHQMQPNYILERLVPQQSSLLYHLAGEIWEKIMYD